MRSKEVADSSKIYISQNLSQSTVLCLLIGGVCGFINQTVPSQLLVGYLLSWKSVRSINQNSDNCVIIFNRLHMWYTINTSLSLSRPTSHTQSVYKGCKLGTRPHIGITGCKLRYQSNAVSSSDKGYGSVTQNRNLYHSTKSKISWIPWAIQY